ncbi:hypothetical protein ACT4UM_03010, partial [Bacillus sp. SS-TM]
MKLRITKKALFILVSVSLLGACSELKDNRVTEHQETPIKSVKKNESVHLPVNIFENNNYKIEGQKVTFTRSITNVEISPATGNMAVSEIILKLSTIVWENS